MTKNKQDDAMYKIMVEFSKTVEMFGLSPLEARLFAYLYLEEKPLTLDDMSEALGKSKTSMSTSIRTLAELNFVTRVWKKGVRKDLYEANDQLYKSFMNVYINKWIDAANNQKDSLLQINNELRNVESEDTVISKRLNNIIDFHKQIEKSFRGMKQI
ncbi:GbsR/MarR family transcriptional regulator [Virgibacillus byunsanensis]|uniref:HTH-type transcriptional regulator n=1 Tax=Virgibacillus byunsanensis TaxID=570945 RepID=A0ABW3LL48_9BACI